MAAGGEEPASLTSGTIFYLLKNPKIMKTVQDEVRGAFKTAEDINHASTANLAYLNAVIDETHRIRPSGAGHFTRRTVRSEMVDGYAVPAGVSNTCKGSCPNRQ